MKFEKFLKSTGAHGQIFERENKDRWLICAGVGMKIPAGVLNLLGAGAVSEKTRKEVEDLIHADTDQKVELKRAMIKDPQGKSGDIIRVFADRDGEEIGIWNADFGLLEKKDVNLAKTSIMDDELDESEFMLILDQNDEVVGFISGTEV